MAHWRSTDGLRRVHLPGDAGWIADLEREPGERRRLDELEAA